MKRYLDYELQDFVDDDHFCHWVLQPDANSILFWDLWLRDHPDKEDLVIQAKRIVLKLHRSSGELVTADILGQTWEEIEAKTLAPQTSKIKRSYVQIIAVAASIVLFCAISILLYQGYSSEDTDASVVSDSHPSKWIENTNDSESVQRIDLRDGSSVTLEPNSSIRYPSVFSEKRRNVILHGDAFFEIARDTTKAFYVYANDAVIRVLGTSFHVKASEKYDEVEVIVKTGKVAVYKREELKELARVKTKKISSVLLTPNQKMVMNRQNLKMVKRLTSAPIQIKPLALLPSLKFEDAYVVDIIKALRHSYGIEIIPTKDADLSCRLTTTLTEKSLYENLDIICYPLGLTYYEKDGRLMIDGKCN